MSAEALAFAVAPCLSRPEGSAYMAVRHLEGLQPLRYLLQILIEHHADAFAESGEPIGRHPAGSLRGSKELLRALPIQKAAEVPTTAPPIGPKSPLGIPPPVSTSSVSSPVRSKVSGGRDGGSPESKHPDIEDPLGTLITRTVQSLFSQTSALGPEGQGQRFLTALILEPVLFSTIPAVLHAPTSPPRRNSAAAEIRSPKAAVSLTNVSMPFSASLCGMSQSEATAPFIRSASDRRRTVQACRALRVQIRNFEERYIILMGTNQPPRGKHRLPLASTYAQYREWKKNIRDHAATQVQALIRSALVRLSVRRRAFAHTSVDEMRPPAPVVTEPQVAADEPTRHNRAPAQPTVPPEHPSPLLRSVRPRSEATPPVRTPLSSSRPSPVPAARTVWTDVPSKTLAVENEVSSKQRKKEKKIEELGKDELQAEKKRIKQRLKNFDASFLAANGRLPSKAEKEPIRALYEEYHLVKTLLRAAEEKAASLASTATVSRDGLTVGAPKTNYTGSVKASALGLGTNPEKLGRDMEINGAARDAAPPQSNLKIDVQQALSSPANAAHASKDRSALLLEKRKLHEVLKRYERDFEAQHGRPVRTIEDIAVVQADYDRYKCLKMELGER